MGPHEITERERLAHEHAERAKCPLPGMRVETVPLDRGGDGACVAESAGALGEGGQVGVEPHPIRSMEAPRRGVPDTEREGRKGTTNAPLMRPIDQVRGELDAEFRTGAQIAARLGMSILVVGGPLGTLRRRGEAEGKLGPRGESLWRKAASRDLHGPRPAESALGLGEAPQIDAEPEPTSPPTRLAARFGRGTD